MHWLTGRQIISSAWRRVEASRNKLMIRVPGVSLAQIAAGGDFLNYGACYESRIQILDWVETVPLLCAAAQPWAWAQAADNRVPANRGNRHRGIKRADK